MLIGFVHLVGLPKQFQSWGYPTFDPTVLEFTSVVCVCLYVYACMWLVCVWLVCVLILGVFFSLKLLLHKPRT